MIKKIIICDSGEIEVISQKSRNHGFGVEIQLFHKPDLCEDITQIDFHKKCIKGLSPISFHSPFADLCPGSSDPMVREVARNRFELGYKVANKLHATHMVFHIGRVPGAGVPKNRANRCVDFRNKFLEGKSDKINYYIENQFDLDPTMLVAIIDGINRDNVKVCLDIGHVHCHSKLPIVERIKILKNRIGYVHIHDNHGEKDEHLGIGKADIPMNEVFTALNTYAPDALWALECKIEDIEKSIKRLQKNKFL